MDKPPHLAVGVRRRGSWAALGAVRLGIGTGAARILTLLTVLVVGSLSAAGTAQARYVGHKFVVQEGLCENGGRISAFPPRQVNSWYYGSASRYSERVRWRPQLYKYIGGSWTYVRSGIWSRGYANIYGLVPAFYDAYGQGHNWAGTGTGGTDFVPFDGLGVGHYAIKQTLLWEKPNPNRSLKRWTPMYQRNRNYCTFV